VKLPRVFCSLEELRLERGDDHHLRHVLRLKPGDRFVASDGAGREALAELLATGFRLVEERSPAAEPGCQVWLLLALARGERFERTLEKATELGVARLTPLLTEHGVVRDPGDNRRERWQRLVREAAALAGRARLPHVDAPWSLDRALSEVDSATRLIFSQGEASWPGWSGSSPDPPGKLGSVALLIGPEGGFSPGELEQARAAGWQAAGLGPRNLRVETAATAALALVLARAGEL
jgi:16S rRNA (uracil1498-N3)-methyltransferase